MAWSEKYRWLTSYAIGIVLLFIPEAFLIGHLVLKLPTARLIEPMAIFAAVFLAAGPFLYKGRTRAREHGDARVMMTTVTLLFLVLLVMGDYFAVRLGEVSVETGRNYIFTAVIFMPICGGISYLIVKKWTLRRLGQKSQG